MLKLLLLLLISCLTSTSASQYSTIQRALISQTQATYHTSINQTKTIFSLQLKRIKNELFFAISNTRLALEGVLIEITKSLSSKSKLISLYEHLWLLDVRLKRFTSLTTATRKAINKLSPPRNIQIHGLVKNQESQLKDVVNETKPEEMKEKSETQQILGKQENSLNLNSSEEIADLLQIYYNEQLRANRMHLHDNDYTLV